jgi:predicted RNA-binding protein with PIN domain
MLILIDGYNVTRRDPATRDLELEEQREALLARLRSRGSVMLGQGRIVVVFDAREGSASPGGSGMLPQVVFARERSADDEIVAIAARAAEKVVLVSDDRDLASRVMVHAKHKAEQRPASSCFEGASRASRGSKRRGSVARDSGLPPGANEINKELKALWLDGDDEE